MKSAIASALYVSRVNFRVTLNKRIADFWSAEDYSRVSIVFGLRFSNTGADLQFLKEVASSGNMLSDDLTAALVEVAADNRIDDLIPFIRKGLQHPSAKVRYFAAEAIGWLGDESDKTHLEGLLKDKSRPEPFFESVGAAAERAIGAIENRLGGGFEER